MAQHRKSKVQIKSKVHTKSKSRKHSKKSMRGGFSSCSSGSMPTKENMTNTPNMHAMHAMPSMPSMPVPSMNAMKGGSIASDIVMGYSNSPPVMNDYANGRNIRDSWYDDSLGAVDATCQKGGSPASDLVMEKLGNAVHTVDYVPEDKIKGDMNSLNLYQTTGGSRRRSRRDRNRKSKSKRNSKKRDHRKRRSSKRSNRNERRRSQRGGHASDWITSQYSLGPINNPSGFDKDLYNPPTLGLAGSGSPMGDLEGANVKHVGAPLV
jgi:hypothetical protein